MGIFHKHEYKESSNGTSLFCSCGKSRVLEHSCEFESFEERMDVRLFGNNQTVQSMKCKTCGNLRTYNLTTGQYD